MATQKPLANYTLRNLLNSASEQHYATGKTYIARRKISNWRKAGSARVINSPSVELTFYAKKESKIFEMWYQCATVYSSARLGCICHNPDSNYYFFNVFHPGK